MAGTAQLKSNMQHEAQSPTVAGKRDLNFNLQYSAQVPAKSGRRFANLRSDAGSKQSK